MVTSSREDGIEMKGIKYPLESFAWHNTDTYGNKLVEIRDADKVTVFKMSIVGHEYLEAKRFEEEFVPMVFKLLNENPREFKGTELPKVTIKPQPGMVSMI